MSAEPAPTDPRALIERQIAMLSELAELGMDLARGAKDCGPERDPALIFARAARAVRQTIALQSRLLKDLADLDKAEACARASQASKRRWRAREIIERAVEDGCEDEDETERLCELAWERLADADDADLADLTTAEVVARICAVLNLPADWIDLPSPSMGEGPGVRVNPAAFSGRSPEAPPSPSPQALRIAPSSPPLPPSRGKGGDYTPAPGGGGGSSGTKKSGASGFEGSTR